MTRNCGICVAKLRGHQPEGHPKRMTTYPYYRAAERCAAPDVLPGVEGRTALPISAPQV